MGRYAVKYCGSCNPRYDRTALVKRLELQLGEALLPCREGEVYGRLYVICGCAARCVDTTKLSAKHLYVIDSPEQMDGLINNMKERSE